MVRIEVLGLGGVDVYSTFFPPPTLCTRSKTYPRFSASSFARWGSIRMLLLSPLASAELDIFEMMSWEVKLPTSMTFDPGCWLGSKVTEPPRAC